MDAGAQHTPLVAALRRSILEAPGLTDLATRQRAFDGAAGESSALEQYLEMVRERSAYITDRSVDELRAQGVAEDALFELTVAAAAGAAFHRLEAGLRAMRSGDA